MSGMSGCRGLKYVSFHEASGYGASSRRYLRALARAPFPVTWAPMVPGRGWRLGYEPLAGNLPDDRETGLLDPEISRLCGRLIEYDTVVVHTVPEYFPLWRAREPGKRIVGYTTWETDRVPDHWPPLLDSVDLLLVPCEWNREVFRRGGVRVPIEVIPHIVHPGPFGETRRDGTCTFYTIGPWTARKAHGNAVRAFAKSFRSSDPVRLVIKTSPEDLTRPRRWRRWFSTRAAVKRILLEHRDAPAVELITDVLSESAIDDLHAVGDCYLALGHGEGWCLPAFDAAAHGRPVVATRFGGPLDYLGDDDAYLVDAVLSSVRDRQGRRSYAPSQRWAIPDLDAAARSLRHVVEHPEEAAETGALAARRVRARYSESAVLDRMLSVL